MPQPLHRGLWVALILALHVLGLWAFQTGLAGRVVEQITPVILIAAQVPSASPEKSENLNTVRIGPCISGAVSGGHKKTSSYGQIMVENLNNGNDAETNKIFPIEEEEAPEELKLKLV